MNKIKVLVVEDVKIAQKIAVMILEAKGCEVDTADTGTQALEQVNKHDYAIIFMDLGLDDIDGLTVTETIRKMENGKKHTPIIALTAHADEDIKAKCIAVGMDSLIEKPLTAESAKSIIAKITQCKLLN